MLCSACSFCNFHQIIKVLIRFIILSLVTLFTYLQCVVFQGELQSQSGMDFVEFLPHGIIVEGEMSYVINEGMRGGHGMDRNFQVPEEEGPDCHTAFTASVSHI